MSYLSLVNRVSHLFASRLDPAESIENAGELIRETFAASHVLILLWHDSYRILGSFESGRPQTSADGHDEKFTFSSPIVVRGARYGWLVLESRSEPELKASLQMTAEILLNLLGQLAEKEAVLRAATGSSNWPEMSIDTSSSTSHSLALQA